MPKINGSGISLGANFSPRYTLFLDDRQQFDDLESMKNFPISSLPDGQIAYVISEKEYYSFDSTNEEDAETGRWRIFKSETSGDTTYSGRDVKLNMDNLNKINGDLDNFSFVDFINILSYKESTVTLTSNLSTLIYESGITIHNGLTLTANIVKGTSKIKQIEFKKNDISVSIITDNVENGGNFTYADGSDISSDTTYKVIITDEDNKIIQKSLSVNFYNPYYYGAVENSIDNLTSTNILSLTKDISKKENKTYLFTANNLYCLFAYPKNYGLLKSILDSNNFENINSMKYTELEIKGIPYYIYQTNTRVICNNFIYKFNY